VSGHTPGPWRVSKEGEWGPGRDERKLEVCLLPHNTYDALEIWCRSDEPDFHWSEPTLDEFDANARLIAAAPELLEALAALYADYKQLADSGDAGNWRLEDTDAGKQALAAIAKATGQ
jgi:hypothetical protein